MDSPEDEVQPEQSDRETEQPDRETEQPQPPHPHTEPDTVEATPADNTTTTQQDTSSPQPATTSARSSASSSVSPTLPPPALFVNALNLQPSTHASEPAANTVTAEEDDPLEDESMDASHTATLTNKFKEDPASVLKLLQSALPMEKLTSLIRTERRVDKKQIKILQRQLEEAYVTLSECAGQKEELHEKIEESNKKIGVKRKQMEELREELRVLGEEELQLKKKRDISYAKCSEIKKQLKSSREAQQQIASFSAKSNSSATTSTS
jgi:hypothetical protein